VRSSVRALDEVSLYEAGGKRVEVEVDEGKEESEGRRLRRCPFQVWG